MWQLIYIQYAEPGSASTDNVDGQLPTYIIPKRLDQKICGYHKNDFVRLRSYQLIFQELICQLIQLQIVVVILKKAQQRLRSNRRQSWTIASELDQQVGTEATPPARERKRETTPFKILV